MAFVNHIPDPFTGRQVDDTFFGELNHATNGVVEVFAIWNLRQLCERSCQHFINRLELAARELPLDDSFQLGLEFNRHIFNLRASRAWRKGIAICDAVLIFV
jgi:hypothetical protein